MAVETCIVHIIDGEGEHTETWTIGEQVSREMYERIKHANGELYAVEYEGEALAEDQVLGSGWRR